MNSDQISEFRNVLETISDRPPLAWVYLPKEGRWNLNAQSATLESEEVPPELEDDPDAGIPELAKLLGLVQVFPVTTLQDIVSNARAQKPLCSVEDLLAAAKFYYERDAFIEF